MKAGRKILDGLTEALAHSRGETTEAREFTVRVPDMIDVKSVRSKLGLTQHEFALQFGFKLETVRNWEQAKRVPEASARVLLKIIDNEPLAVMKVLSMEERRLA
jgi:putative transcriptional regulator